MPNIFSRPEPPEPWPTDFKEDGAIHGDLPLVVPRPKRHSNKVIIVEREGGTTFYDFYRGKDPIRFRIDTKYEWVLLCALNLISQKAPYRLTSGGVPLARIIALHHPSTDLSRDQVDHADRDTTNDCEANLHWVTSQFNSFNVKRTTPTPATGFFGVSKNGPSYAVEHRERYNGTYSNAETAGLVYNLLCRISYGVQLDKTPHLLNQIADEEKRVTKIESLNDGVDIYKVDDTFIVIYEEIVRYCLRSLAVAREEAKGLVEKEKKERQEEEEKWAKRKSWIRVGAREKGVAVIGLLASKDDVVDVLLDDDDWKMFYAMDATLSLTRHKRIVIRLGKKVGNPFLSRLLCKAEVHEVVDHVNGNIHDHRRANLKIIDRSANRQNSRLAHRNECGYIGVRQLASKSYRTSCSVRGENRTATTTFPSHELEKAVELYDLTSLYQFGETALINHPDKLEEYLAMLKQEETIGRIVSFLSAKTKSSLYRGVSFTTQKGRWPCWVALVEYENRKTVSQIFSAGETGTEVRAAICADLLRLTLQSRDMTVNFERMRPYYHFVVDNSKDWSKTPESRKAVVERAYKAIGGNRFAKSLEVNDGDSASTS
ncbi:hypothetical protein PHSY_001055 [Pseudozyma hubeiensis SY62]|uniref:HNH nuclease domain-containing protein n=1 Tax=Pseudozyma hubeiensis (strain SY62) TaxID=1305764 RepID=R9P5W2_PSEHS|nr:hypothetical protein PHSY_001055 [Pseudozyma hubeiensis SY62]GAC93490.1 hypothetical protein PHSY_001055 [Pseudozyma hubeiensis SY62]